MKKSELTEYIKQVMSSKITTENVEDGTSNVVDTIRMDVPLFIRLLEYAREDAKTDMDLHNVTEKAISLSVDGGTLTMSDYNNIISTPESIDEMKNPKLTKIAGDIMAKFPKQGSYDAFEEFKKHIGKYKLTSDEEKEVYAVIRDKENEDLAEVAIGEKKLTAAEKAKKEEIVKSMKKTFKGPEAAMYAIATDKAKKVAEANDKVKKYVVFDKARGENASKFFNTEEEAKAELKKINAEDPHHGDYVIDDIMVKAKKVAEVIAKRLKEGHYKKGE